MQIPQALLIGIEWKFHQDYLIQFHFSIIKREFLQVWMQTVDRTKGKFPSEICEFEVLYFQIPVNPGFDGETFV